MKNFKAVNIIASAVISLVLIVLGIFVFPKSYLRLFESTKLRVFSVEKARKF